MTDQATEYLRRFWTKVGRYFSQPDVKSILDELVGDAFSQEDASVETELSLIARWYRRRFRVHDFEGIVTRAPNEIGR